jgi:hypothetical protein
MSFLGKIFRSNEPERRKLTAAVKHFHAINQSMSNQITAASTSPGKDFTGIQTYQGDDSLNRAYLENLAEVQSRAQDIDVNNPDIHGFHRTRTAQVIGAGVKFKLAPHQSEVGLDHDELLELTQAANRIRQIHSRTGGFDSTGLRRSEGKQQERAFLTALVLGSCLIHRVWRMNGKHRLPLSLELIAGSRISTPYDKMGDPLVSYGMRYSDEHRTRVVGWYVRRVSKTIGNSFVPDFIWDFIPVEDGSLLSLTEIAGIDRALPLSTSTVRMLRNRGEFLENAVESARAQATHYAVMEVGEGQDPYAVAADDADAEFAQGGPAGFTRLGNVQMLYALNGEKVTWASSKLPEPDLTGFMSATDERLSRGLVSSLSRFTRHVTSSWAGGRMEDQQDDPIIEQYRDAFVSAWEAVNEWFMEAVYLTDAVKLPGYNAQTAALWCEFRAQFPGKVHINPTDTSKSRMMDLGMRNTTPQRCCEEDGVDLRENLREWGEAVKMRQEVEKEFGLEEGELDFLLEGRFLTTSAGEEIGPDKAVEEPSPPVNRMKRILMNRLSRLGETTK